MTQISIILDTGPLVAVLNRYDTYYHWATQQMANVQSPVLTCEAVISEAYLLSQVYFNK